MATTDPTEGATRADGAGRNIGVAIGVGIGLAVAFVGTILIHPLLFLAFVALNLGVALYELDAAFARQKEHPPTIAAAIALPFMLGGAYLYGADAVIAGAAGGLVLGFAITMATNERGHTVSRMAALSLMLVWVNVMAASLGLLLARDDGHWYVMAITALTVTSDIGAFAFGRTFGRTKLAPTISPKKTWEGLIGAMVPTLLMAAFVTTATVPRVTLVPALVLAVVVVAAGTVGDLAESLVKRDLGVKDLGSIFPAHGGVMDRVDALLFALPAGHVVLLAFGI